MAVDNLMTRAEPYPAEVPDGVRLITLGGDDQKGTVRDVDEGGKPPRHEFQIVGWGYGEESWVIDHVVIDEHEPFSPAAKEAIIALLQRDWMKRDGTRMRIAGAAIDVNFRMNEGLAFCNSDEVLDLGIPVWPAVGKNEAKGTRCRFASESLTARRGSIN